MKLVKVLFGLIFLTVMGCSNQRAVEEKNVDKITSVSLVTWNLQTFFDAVTTGKEYAEFKKSGNWNEAKYKVRLERLCETITTLNADIFVFEEVENAGIIQDISNLLTGKSWNGKKAWSHACFSSDGAESIGCAVLSKYPLKDMSIHRIDIRTQKSRQPSLRPLIQVTVDVGGKELLLFANHWKSKSGGQAESEIWRDWQEFLLAERISELAVYGTESVVACGDFNRDALEFFCDFNSPNASPSPKSNTYLRYARIDGPMLLPVYSPWFLESGSYSTETGSYYYNETWERIDNIFVCGNVLLNNFTVRSETPWITEERIPDSYKIYSGNGYSDHLPLMCTLSL